MARTDRALAGVLLVFFLSLYLMTGGGHRYSPDGEFAYRVARSATLDPEHRYLQTMRKGLDQWGVMVPLLSQPLVLLGEPPSNIAPQKDYATVDGRTHVLGIFRNRELPEGAPTVGPRAPGVEESYVRTDLQVGPATSLATVSFLALAGSIPQGAVVAELTLVDREGSRLVFPLRAGVETAEWSLARGNSEARHGMGRVASIWGGNTGGRNYFVELSFGRVFQPEELRVRYLLPQGHLYLRSLMFLNYEAGTTEPLLSEARFWSESENHELFTSFFFSFYNSIITALGCVLLFSLVRLLSYSPMVAVAATLVYGLATAAWPYSKYDFSEPTLVMFVLATLHLILRWGKEGRDRLLLIAGFTALACVGTKYASAMLVPVMAAQVLLLHWEKHPSAGELPGAIRPLLLFGAPFVALAIPALVLLSSSFGYDPTFVRAFEGVREGWLPLPFILGLQGLLFSPGKSVFLFSPPTLLGLLSIVPFVRRHGARAFGPLALILVYFTIYTMKTAWHAGAGWGPRYQVVAVPLMILVAAPLLERALDGRRRWARAALLAAFVLGVGLQLLGVAKSFDDYLGIFRAQVFSQLPDEGRRYSMTPEYFDYAQGLDDGNSITATVLAWPFSPVLAHGWLVSANLLAVGPSFLQPAKDRVLATPPWRLLGIDVTMEHPEYGISNFDFWTMRMRTDFPSYPDFLALVFLVLLLLEIALVASGARLVSFLFHRSVLRAQAVRAWLAASIFVLLAFDGIHAVL